MTARSRSVSISFTVKVSAASLCNLTKQFVHGSAKYQAATSSQRGAVDLVVSGACVALGAKQTALYKTVVSSGLANNGWLTSSQATALRSLADKL